MKGVDLVSDLFIPDEKRAMDIFRGIRWANGVYCPSCHSLSIENRGSQGKSCRYSCNGCGLNFSDLTGTIFAKRKLPMGDMLYILFNLDKKSIKRLSEELGHKWGNLYHLAQDFKEDLAKKSGDPKLQGKIEIDEMYIHAGSKGLKKSFQEKEDSKAEEEEPEPQTNHQLSQ